MATTIWKRIPLKDVDWKRLFIHLVGSLIIVLGITGQSHGDILPILEQWFFGVLVYTGGYIQAGEKQKED